MASSLGCLALLFVDVYLTFEPCKEKWEKAWYHSYITKPQGGLDHDVHGLGFSNDGNVPMHKIALDWKWHKTARLLFQFTYLQCRIQHLNRQPSSDVVVRHYYNWIQDFDWPLAQLIFNLALSPGSLELCYLSCIFDLWTEQRLYHSYVIKPQGGLDHRLDHDVGRKPVGRSWHALTMN